ncbi:hypothetical protein Tco_0067673, partial [Tanacetum coccineum]
EHLALADSSLIPIVDLVPSAGDTKGFKTDEYAPTPRSPQIRIPFAQTRLRRARKTIRLEPPIPPSMEAGSRDDQGDSRDGGGDASLFIPPLVDRREDIPEAELPPRKRLCSTAPTSRDVWVDPTEAVEEVALTTLEWVNARVTELAAVQEQDTHDVYAMIEDTQDRQTQLF